jgi:hypothetical protein
VQARKIGAGSSVVELGPLPTFKKTERDLRFAVPRCWSGGDWHLNRSRLDELAHTPSRCTSTMARRVVAKVEFHCDELFPRVGFIVTNLGTSSRAVVRFYNKRGTAEQWREAPSLISCECGDTVEVS